MDLIYTTCTQSVTRQTKSDLVHLSCSFRNVRNLTSCSQTFVTKLIRHLQCLQYVLSDYTFCLKDLEYATFTRSLPFPISSSIHYVHFFLDSVFTFSSFHSSLVQPRIVHLFPPSQDTHLSLLLFSENLVLFHTPPFGFLRFYSSSSFYFFCDQRPLVSALLSPLYSFVILSQFRPFSVSEP